MTNQQPAQPRKDDPAVVNFLNRVRDLEDDNAELHHRLNRHTADLSTATQLNADLRRQVQILTVERDRNLRIATILETHIKRLSGGCLQALDDAKEVEKQLYAIKREPDQLTAQEASTVERIGRRFGSEGQP